MQDIEKELKELRNKQDTGKAKLEQSVTDTAIYLQEQVSEWKFEVFLPGCQESVTWFPLAISLVSGPLPVRSLLETYVLCKGSVEVALSQ